MTDWFELTPETLHHCKTGRQSVHLAGPSYEIYAQVRPHPRLSKGDRLVWWWYEVTYPKGLLKPLCGLGMQGDWHPTHFRPTNLQTWPHQLPKPIPKPVPPAPAAKAPPPIEDGTQEGDGWPYPRLRLGDCIPPTSIKECEARILRHIRTERSNAVAGLRIGRPEYATDIPREMIQIALKYERAGNGDNTLVAIPSSWEPNRRDIGDWLYVAEWLRGVVGKPKLILEMRAANPVWSYHLIGKHDKILLTEAGVRGIYRETIKAIFRRVGG